MLRVFRFTGVGEVPQLCPALPRPPATEGDVMSEVHEPIPDEADIGPDVQLVPDDEREADETSGEDDRERDDAQHEPEPAQGMTEREWEERFKKTDKAFAAYTRRITDLWGDDALDLLPVVVSPSAPPGFLHRGDAGRVPDDVKQPIMEFFGIAREQEYAADPVARTCSTCDGLGKTATGSKVAGNESRTCPTCNGMGYEAPGAANGVSAVVLDGTHAPAGERREAVAAGDVDNWGEPKILPDGRPNPNFGKMPQFKVPVEPWGVTSNLTVQDAKAV